MAANDELEMDDFDSGDGDLSFDDMDLDGGMDDMSEIELDEGDASSPGGADEFDEMDAGVESSSDEELLGALSEDAPLDEPETVSADADMQFDVDGSADDLQEFSMDTETVGGQSDSEESTEEEEEDPFTADLDDSTPAFEINAEDEEEDPFLTESEEVEESVVAEPLTAPEPAPAMPEVVPPVIAAGIAAVGIVAENSAQVTGELSVGTELLLNVQHEATVEIARTRLTGEEITQLTHGSVIELEKAAGEPVDIVLNGRVVAHGEIVVINQEKLGVRIIGIHQG